MTSATTDGGGSATRAPEGKNIVLLSDGTGNSAAAVWRTNVWRVYQALDLSKTDQIARYDDGVGTSTFKPLAMLGGAFGWGLKRNMLALYVFLCLNYEEGDKIFAFGFSRGAFAIRMLIDFIARKGLLDPRTGDEALRLKTPYELAQEAELMFRAYRHRDLKWYRHLLWAPVTLWDLIVAFSRKALGKTTPGELSGEHKPDIAFVGLWDTVGAYGLPMQEMTLGIDLLFWPLSLGRQSLDPKVKRACHALALDDERTTFEPLLWDERDEKEIHSPASTNITNIKQERISQVWFSGMHANVGGGYPDDGMAHVSLDWIMTEAEEKGLRFKKRPVRTKSGEPAKNYYASAHDDVRNAADACGRIYNSREGFASYYRYGPRRIDYLTDTKKVSIQLPKIHESVFERIQAGTGGYAPFVLPERYMVVLKSGAIVAPGEQRTDSDFLPVEHPTQALDRTRRQENVWNWVWARRVIYFVTLIATVLLIAWPCTDADGCGGLPNLKFPLSDRIFDGPVTLGGMAGSIFGPLFGTPRAILDMACNCVPESLTLYLGRFIEMIMSWLKFGASLLLPKFADEWLDFYQKHYDRTAAVLLLIGALLLVGKFVERQITARMRLIWDPIVQNPGRPVVPVPLPNSFIFKMRSSRTYRGMLHYVKYRVLPIAWALVFGGAGLLAIGAIWEHVTRAVS